MKEFRGFSHGINLGGWYSQSDYSEERYDDFIKKEDFEIIASWGLDHVRLPIDYNLFLDEKDDFIEEGMDRIKKAIAWAKDTGLNVILDLHKTKGFSFDEGEKEAGFFENERYQELFYRIWEELTRRFAGEGIAFDLLNEITDAAYMNRWNKIAQTCAERIRRINKDVYVMVGGYGNNRLEAISDIAVHDDRLVYSFHCYSPLIFTHQGAYWIRGMDTAFRMDYDSSAADYMRYAKMYLPEDNQDPLPMDKMNEDYFRNRFRPYVALAKERNIPLYCGEYGVIDRARVDDAYEWISCINRVFDEYGISRAIWSYKEMDFGLLDKRYDELRERIVACL